jgi:hypothetical protein
MRLTTLVFAVITVVTCIAVHCAADARAEDLYSIDAGGNQLGADFGWVPQRFTVSARG